MRVWKGSVMKLLWPNLLLFLALHTSLSLLYRVVLMPNPKAKEYFELVCVYCSRWAKQKHLQGPENSFSEV